jgi:O-antigen ligase
VSIGALIAAGAATVVWLAFQRISIHGLLALAALATCAVALVSLQSIRGAPHSLERLESATTSSSSPEGGTQLGSVDQRIRTYRVATAMIREDPFVGVGLDLSSVARPFGVEGYEYDVHNLVIGLWYKTGLVGLLGMLLALLAIVRSGWTAIWESITESERKVAVALGSSVVAFVVFAMTAPILFTRLGWISAALVLALRSVQLDRLKSVEPAARPRVGRRPLAASVPP